MLFHATRRPAHKPCNRRGRAAGGVEFNPASSQSSGLRKPLDTRGQQRYSETRAAAGLLPWDLAGFQRAAHQHRSGVPAGVYPAQVHRARGSNVPSKGRPPAAKRRRPAALKPLAGLRRHNRRRCIPGDGESPAGRAQAEEPPGRESPPAVGPEVGAVCHRRKDGQHVPVRHQRDVLPRVLALEAPEEAAEPLGDLRHALPTAGRLCALILRVCLPHVGVLAMILKLEAPEEALSQVMEGLNLQGRLTKLVGDDLSSLPGSAEGAAVDLHIR
mmetsp:Transcript_42822/g.101635  ORF Transcript_42822/g.101635 Transcript_42822/m.101635 type:complete len:272 (-) Transcript_42822:608-1423(-)